MYIYRKRFIYIYIYVNIYIYIYVGIPHWLFLLAYSLLAYKGDWNLCGILGGLLLGVGVYAVPLVCTAKQLACMSSP